MMTSDEPVKCATCGKDRGPIYRFVAREIWVSSLGRWISEPRDVELCICKGCTDKLLAPPPKDKSPRAKGSGQDDLRERSAAATLRSLLKGGRP